MIVTLPLPFLPPGHRQYSLSKYLLTHDYHTNDYPEEVVRTKVIPLTVTTWRDANTTLIRPQEGHQFR